MHFKAFSKYCWLTIFKKCVVTLNFLWISIALVKICFSRIFSKPRKNTYELVGTVLKLITSLKLENGNVEFLYQYNYRYITDKMILSKNYLYPGDLPQTWITSRPTFFKITQMQSFQSCPFVSIHASLSFCCVSFVVFNIFKWFLQCFIPHFGHFGCHEITSFCVT